MPKIVRIAGANCLLTPPKNWDTAELGECEPCSVRLNGDLVQSAWVLDEVELATLAQPGAYLVLTIFGAVPPVSLHVESIHEQDNDGTVPIQ